MRDRCNKAICFDNKDGSQVIVKVNDVIDFETFKDYQGNECHYIGKVIEIKDKSLTIDCSEQYESNIIEDVYFCNAINITKL